MASKGAAFDLAVGWWNLSTIYLFRSLLGWIALTCDGLFSLFSLLTTNGSSSKAQLSVSCCICWTDVVSSLTRISEGSKKYHFLPLMIKTHAFTQMSCVHYVIGCCPIPLGICGLKNNSRRITYGIGCVWGMPSLSPLSSLDSYWIKIYVQNYLCSTV